MRNLPYSDVQKCPEMSCLCVICFRKVVISFNVFANSRQVRKNVRTFAQIGNGRDVSGFFPAASGVGKPPLANRLASSCLGRIARHGASLWIVPAVRSLCQKSAKAEDQEDSDRDFQGGPYQIRGAGRVARESCRRRSGWRWRRALPPQTTRQESRRRPLEDKDQPASPWWRRECVRLETVCVTADRQKR